MASRDHGNLARILIQISLLLSSITHTNTTWWYLSQLGVQSLSLVGSGAICNIPGLIGRQRRLCREEPDVMLSVVKGAKMGVSECQNQFQNNRWNCSTSDRDSSVFGKVMLTVGSREAAFVYAISSAGVVHAITRACSQGTLLNCACDPSKRGYGRDRRGEFDWGGCSDNVRYGAKFARRFVDAREQVRDARALMNLHNNRAGRRAVRRHMSLECKCHGVSGSCTMRTCWLALQDFHHVGDRLRRRYNGATQVRVNQKGNELVVANRNHKRPTRSDLVYFEESPDYCIYDPDMGSLGTAGRECNRTSLGPEGCDLLCCGRGFNTRRVKRTTKCDCKFHWCCYVKCKECSEIVEVHTCKGPNPTPSPPNTLSNNVYLMRN